jgi:hypothetical protein
VSTWDRWDKAAEEAYETSLDDFRDKQALERIEAGLDTHDGSLISGTVTCTCCWQSQHRALAIDAVKEWERHLADEGVDPS